MLTCFSLAALFFYKFAKVYLIILWLPQRRILLKILNDIFGVTSERDFVAKTTSKVIRDPL